MIDEMPKLSEQEIEAAAAFIIETKDFLDWGKISDMETGLAWFRSISPTASRQGQNPL